MKKTLKLASLVLALIMVATVFAGCAKTGTDRVDETPKPVSSGSEETSTQQVDTSATGGLVLPIVKNKITLKYWVVLANEAVGIITDFNQNEVYKELERRTGIHIEFIHPADAEKTEQFNLMIASGDLPDIIEGDITKQYPGGPLKAIEDGYYLRLNDVIDQYAPNYKALLNSNPKIAKECMLDDGTIWAFSCIQKEEEPPWKGAYMRKDYLDKVGLPVPTSIEEWEVALRAFKEKLNLEAPMLLDKTGMDSRGTIIGSFGAMRDWIQVNGEVRYGPIEPGMKDYLETMNRWYTEGLIDRDFPTRDKASFDALISSGGAGAWIGSYGETETYLMANKDNPEFEIVPVPYPTYQGKPVHIRQTNFHNKGYHTVISAKSKYIEEAVKWLDYHYSEEGALLINYGIEGKSYIMVDGKPQFTDLMLNNPDGLSFHQLAWVWKIHMGPYLRDPIGAYKISDLALESMRVWAQTDNSYIMPDVSLTAEENKIKSDRMGDIETYRNEMVLKFILGEEPISNFDKFVEQIKSMGIDEVRAVYQSALDRYNARSVD